MPYVHHHNMGPPQPAALPPLEPNPKVEDAIAKAEKLLEEIEKMRRVDHYGDISWVTDKEAIGIKKDLEKMLSEPPLSNDAFAAGAKKDLEHFELHDRYAAAYLDGKNAKANFQATVENCIAELKKHLLDPAS